MKIARRNAALLAATMLLATAATAAADDDAPQGATDSPATARVHFTSSKSIPAVHHATCELLAVNAINGRARSFDVFFEEERCSSSPAEKDAIPLHVLMQLRGGASFDVFLEAEAPTGVSADDLRAAVERTGRELKSRLERRPAPVVTSAPSSSKPTVNNPGLYGFGIAFIAIGGSALAAAAFVAIGTAIVGAFETTTCAFGNVLGGKNCSSDVSGGLVGALALAGGGIVFLVTGGVAIGVGGRQVASVTVAAVASPTGGALRVTF